jgi:HAD superfamily hydrolase (TIGR01484 family)
MKELFVFDLDGTLAASKAPIDAQMGSLLSSLLGLAKVAVISGGAWQQFEEQLLAHLPPSDGLGNLSLLPTCGAQFFQYRAGWERLYAEDFTTAEKTKIVDSLRQVTAAADSDVGKIWGAQVEDRGSQITYSALGQQAPLGEKLRWDSDFNKRRKIKVLLDPLLPEFSVRLGGATSIDITKQGVDKGYGIRKLRDVLHVPIKQMVFVGDAVFPGGNDYPAKEAGALSITVQDPKETRRVIEVMLACLS